jgi:hypothetical protein
MVRVMDGYALQRPNSAEITSSASGSKAGTGRTWNSHVHALLARVVFTMRRRLPRGQTRQ